MGGLVLPGIGPPPPGYGWVSPPTTPYFTRKPRTIPSTCQKNFWEKNDPFPELDPCFEMGGQNPKKNFWKKFGKLGFMVVSSMN